MIIEADKKKSNVIGRLGENEARVIRFDVGSTQRDFPGCSFAVLNRRPNDSDAYPVNSSYVTAEGGYLLWTVVSGDVAQEGIGECEVVASVGSKIVKSEIYQTRILHALDGAGTPPEPWESWVQDVTDAADRAEAAAELLEHPGAEATTLEPGESATAGYSDGTFSFGIPRGADGAAGMDGRDGQDGHDGQDGQDGITPNVTAGTTTTGAAGTDASVTRRQGSPDSDPVFDFVIPKGDKGDPGEVTEAELSAGLATKADLIYDTVTDQSIATIQDGADNLPMSVTAEINPVQDLHGQDSPYPAGGGKNKLDNDAFKTFANWNSGLVSVGTYSTSTTYRGYDITSLLTVGTEYTISFAFPSTGLPVYCALCSSDGSTSTRLKAFTDSSSVINTSHTFTPESGITYYIRSGTCTTESDFNNTVKNIISVQLEVGSTATSYVPYSNICPISGRDSVQITGTGKNLIDATEIYTGSNFTWNNGEVTSTAAKFYAVKYSIPSKLIGKTLTFQAYAVANGSVNLCTCANVNGTNIIGNSIAQNATGKMSVTFTPSSANDTIFINYGSSGGGTVTLKELMLAEETTASAYEPFGTDYPITFASTVYGGTVKVNKDGSRKCFVAENTVTYDGSNDETINRGNASEQLRMIIKLPDDAIKTGAGWCNSLKWVSPKPNMYAGEVQWYEYSGGSPAGIYADCRFPVGMYTDDDAGRRAFLASNPIQFVYELATPIEIDLTDSDAIVSLKGVNNVWSDTGNVSMTYPCDTKLYIDKKITQLQALILDN